MNFHTSFVLKHLLILTFTELRWTWLNWEFQTTLNPKMKLPNCTDARSLLSKHSSSKLCKWLSRSLWFQEFCASFLMSLPVSGNFSKWILICSSFWHWRSDLITEKKLSSSQVTISLWHTKHECVNRENFKQCFFWDWKFQTTLMIYFNKNSWFLKFLIFNSKFVTSSHNSWVPFSVKSVTIMKIRF
jgi:hypothetical protein